MDEVAKFVYASGGAVSVAELQRFFTENPLVESAFYATAAPVRQLKSVLRHHGHVHGLSWHKPPVAWTSNPSANCARPILHTLTDAQRDQFATAKVELMVPRALDAMEKLLRGTRDQRLKVGELAAFYSAFPTETQFMKRHSGSVKQFIHEYGTAAMAATAAQPARFATSDTALWLVDPSDISSAGTSSCISNSSSSRGTSGSSPALRAHLVGDPRRVDAAVHTAVALRALVITCRVVFRLRVYRSPCSLSLSSVLIEICRMSQQQPLAVICGPGSGQVELPSRASRVSVQPMQNNQLIKRAAPMSVETGSDIITTKTSETSPTASDTTSTSSPTASSSSSSSEEMETPPPPPEKQKLLQPQEPQHEPTQVVRCFVGTPLVRPGSLPSSPLLKPAVLQWDACTFALPRSDHHGTTALTTTTTTRQATTEPSPTPPSSSAIVAPCDDPPPKVLSRRTTTVTTGQTRAVVHRAVALRALIIACRVVFRLRVFRPPCSLSLLAVFTEICRVSQRPCPRLPLATAKRLQGSSSPSASPENMVSYPHQVAATAVVPCSSSTSSVSVQSSPMSQQASPQILSPLSLSPPQSRSRLPSRHQPPSSPSSPPSPFQHQPQSPSPPQRPSSPPQRPSSQSQAQPQSPFQSKSPLPSLYRTYREWIAQLEGDTTVDEPPSKPKPETEATDEDAEDDDAAEQEESGWADMMASNLKQFVRKAAAAVVNRRNDQDDGERSTVDGLDDGNDDDDTKSVNSVGSDCSGTSFGSDGSEKTASKKWKHKRNEKRARAWCLKNSVNSKAMGIAQATAKELLSTLSRAKAWSHGAVRTDTATNAAVTDEQLRRLLTAGFFLNAAVNKPVSPSLPRRGGPQYYALYSDVLGSLFMGSALHLMEKKRDPLPSWILFDSILRLNATTLLSLATPIEETWIKDESPAFYEVCTANRAKLPVLTFEYEQLSFAVLRNLFGKSFHQVNRWESQLKCTLSIDNEVGTLTVFCAPVHEAHIRSTFESKFATLQKRLANEANEEVYMGTTRAVIGHGFQAQALLFDKDFVAITVRNLPNISDHEFEQRLVQWTRQAGCSVDAIRCADLLRNSTSSKSTMSATIKFVTKEAAHQVYECMRGDSSGGAAGSALSVTPLRIMGDQSSAAAIRADFAGRIKLTWADGEATGGAHVFFRSPLDANEFVRNATTVLASPTRIQVFALGQLAADQAVVAAAATDVSLAAPAPISRGRGGAKSPPKWAKSQGPPAVPQSPITKELTGDGSAYQVVFDTAKITQLPLEQQARLRFGVHIKCGLPPSMDEHQLLETIRRTTANVAHARILRKPATASVINTNESELERRFARMMPLVTCLDDTSVYTDFVDEKARRAGVVVFCRDMRSLNETYQMARGSPLWEELERPHGQPIRMELENSYTTSIHSDIHRCFREQIALILTYARAKGAMYQESQPSALAATAPASKNMVTLKFLGDMAALQRVKAKLDDVLSCEKVSTPDIMLLFSVTGRYKAQEWIAKHMDADNLTSRYFVRWINTKHEFWVYGDAPSRQDAVQKLLELARQIKELDVLDKVVRLNKYKNPKAPPIKQWLAKCPAAQELFAYWTQSTTRLLVSGSQTQVQAVLEALDKEGLLFKERKTKVKDGAKPICAVCGFTVDDPFMLATICNHAYCIDCVQPMAQPMTCSLPLVCPALGCGQTLHVDDVAKLVNGANALSGLVEMAVFDFVAKHQDRAFVCLKPGCNQILSAASITGESDAAVGGRSIYCDQCNADYCVGCSAVAAGRAVPRHAKLTCEAFRARQVSPQIAVHLKFIQEQILNASCPNCHAVFLDFTGCTSVQCGNATCGQFFCANCLVFSSKSSSDTHNHVARCESNPSVAHGGLKNYFVDTAELDAVHRLLRCQKLATYFTETLKDDAVRYMVYKRLAKDLQDLGVDIPETLKGSKEGSRDACFVFGDDDDEDVEQETPADRTIRDHIHHVREHLFNLKCPKCQLVFVDFDFDSCAALTCANPICAGGFCAYCLADCGADAHKHVSGCAKNPNRPYYYITEEEFRRVHKERREALVGSYLRDVVKANDGLELAQRVREALAEDFRSIGLEIGPIQ